MSVDEPVEKGQAGKIAQLIHDAFVKSRDTIRGAETAAADARLTRWLDAHEDEFAPVVGRFLGHLVDHPELDEKTNVFLKSIIDPDHATKLGLIAAAAAAIVYPMISAAIQPTVRDVEQKANQANPNAVLPPGEVGTSWLRGKLSTAQALAELEYAGLSGWRANRLLDNEGGAPGIGQLLEMWRRSIINSTAVTTGLQQNGLRDEWIYPLEQMYFDIQPTGIIVAATVQNHLDFATGKAMAAKNGVDPADFDWLYETYGRPPGTETMLKLLNRGIIDQGTVVQAILESDIKNKYIQPILDSRVYIPPVRTIPALLRHGAIDKARALQLLKMNGVTDQDALAYADVSSTAKTIAQKDLSVSQHVKAYSFGITDRATAVARISALHYDTAEANEILDLEDHRVHEQLIHATITKIRAAYLAHKITAQQAGTDLDQLSITAQRKQQLLDLWAIERSTQVATLTVSQYQGAYRRGIITLPSFLAHMTTFGYNANEAKILAAEAFPPGKTPQEVIALP